MEVLRGASSSLSVAQRQNNGSKQSSSSLRSADFFRGSSAVQAFATSGRQSAGRRQNAGRLTVRAVVPKELIDVEEVDKEKFQSMVFRRTVFTHEDWKRHKSSGRHLRHLKNMFTSRVIRALGPPVSIMTGVASGVVGWNTLVTMDVLPEWAHLLHLSSQPFSLTAPALSFLLVFRTNASYGRFDEVRKMWGLMLNRTRDTARLALSYMARDEYSYEYPKRAQFLRHLQAFALTYKHHFLQEGSLEEDLKNYTSLTPDEISAIVAAGHRPNYMQQMMSECLRNAHIHPIHRFNMDQNLMTFADDIGGSERIFKTPIPVSYTRLTSRFLFLYHLFLPLALWDACGYLTIPVTVVSTAIFFCIEEVGVLIEEPFSILALDAIAASARNNVAELIAQHDGIMSLVVSDDEDMKYAIAAGKVPRSVPVPTYVPPPEPVYLPSSNEEELPAEDEIPKILVSTTSSYSSGPYSDF